MLNFINVIIRRTVERILEMFDENGKTEEIVDNAAQRVAERISDKDLVRKVAERIGGAEVAEHIDVETVAGHVDVYDIASNIDVDEIARNIDLNDLADRVVDLLPERPASPAPEPEVPVSDPSLIERLLEKAVDRLLERAEEAARNGQL
jgi:hypothetical protein